MDGAELRSITWLDSNVSQGWHDPTCQEYKPLVVSTVGYVLSENTKCVTVAGSVIWGEDFQAIDAMTIPRGCIVRQHTLQQPHSATHSAKPDPGKGQTPETP